MEKWSQGCFYGTPAQVRWLILFSFYKDKNKAQRFETHIPGLEVGLKGRTSAFKSQYPAPPHTHT
jgi:hypothetical protein